MKLSYTRGIAPSSSCCHSTLKWPHKLLVGVQTPTLNPTLGELHPLGLFSHCHCCIPSMRPHEFAGGCVNTHPRKD